MSFLSKGSTSYDVQWHLTGQMVKFHSAFDPLLQFYTHSASQPSQIQILSLLPVIMTLMMSWRMLQNAGLHGQCMSTYDWMSSCRKKSPRRELGMSERYTAYLLYETGCSWKYPLHSPLREFQPLFFVSFPPRFGVSTAESGLFICECSEWQMIGEIFWRRSSES